MEHIRSLVGEVSVFGSEPDGVEFDAASIDVCRVPGHAEIPAAGAHGISERDRGCRKLEALTVLGLLNSRIKDYYDIALLARLYPFDGDLLAEAIRSTFRHRGTTIDATPIGLTEAFISDPARAAQWRAFVRRSRFDSESGLDEIVKQVRRFALAPLSAIAGEDSFHRQWRPGGPWE